MNQDARAIDRRCRTSNSTLSTPRRIADGTLYAHSERISEIRRPIAQSPQLFRCVLDTLLARLFHHQLPLLVDSPVRQRHDRGEDETDAYEQQLKAVCMSPVSSTTQ